jgi:hypothetical protein
VAARPRQQVAATVAAQWQWPSVMVRVQEWVPKDMEMAVEVVVHAVEHEGAWSIGSGSDGQSLARRLPWRPWRRLCPRVRVQQQGRERVSGLRTSFGSPHREKGGLCMRTGSGARCGHERHVRTRIAHGGLLLNTWWMTV